MPSHPFINSAKPVRKRDGSSVDRILHRSEPSKLSILDRKCISDCKLAIIREKRKEIRSGYSLTMPSGRIVEHGRSGREGDVRSESERGRHHHGCGETSTRGNLSYSAT